MFVSVLTLIVFVPATIIFLFDFDRNSEDFSTDEISVLINGKIEKYDIEEYLFGVVAAEMPAAFHEEALKAQAVAARTYIINKSLKPDNDHPNADVCTDSTHCKAYISNDEIVKKHGKNWMGEYSGKIKNCINKTAGEIAVYSDEPIEAVFHSTGSGVTENAKDVWGSDVPYLVSVESPGDMLSPVFENDITVSFSEFKDKIYEKSGIEISPYIGEILRNESGSVKNINLGGVSLEGVEVRSIFSLPSTNFTVTAADNSFIFHCKGKGHGVGMSQYGAEYFAKQGMNYKEILKKYYSGIEIKNIGDLYDKSNQN